MQMSRFITEKAAGIGLAIMVVATLYGCTMDDPPRQPATERSLSWADR